MFKDTHIGLAIHKMLAQNKALREAFELYEIKKNMNLILGHYFVQKGVTVKSRSGKKLFLTCESAPLRSEIRMRKQDIINRLNAAMKADLITDIVIVS